MRKTKPTEDVTEVEAEAAIELRPVAPVEAEVVGAAKAETGTLSGREETAGIERSGATAGTVTATAMIGGGDQAETDHAPEIVIETAIETAIEDEATARAVEVVAASDETVTESEYQPLLISATLPSLSKINKLVSRSVNNKRRRTLQHKKRLERKACRFRVDGMIETEGSLLTPARLPCEDVILLVTGIEIVKDHHV